MNSKNAFEAVDVLIQGMNRVERSGFFEHLKDTYPHELGMVVVGETAAVEPINDIWQALSPEQRERAGKLRAAMAEKFNVSEEDFSLVQTKSEKGEPVFTLLYTAGNGIDLGDPKEIYDEKRSWTSIFDSKNDGNFIIEIDGRQVDTRKGTTRAVYDAMYNEAKANGQVLPDSRELSEQNGQPRTYTWLTGEKAGRGGAPFANVNVGVINRDWSHPGGANHNVRFRPAAEL